MRTMWVKRNCSVSKYKKQNRCIVTFINYFGQNTKTFDIWQCRRFAKALLQAADEMEKQEK